MTHTWTLEVNGIERKYKSLNFQRDSGLVITEFTATVKYSIDLANAGFLTVAIKNNGVLEWFGFLEDAKPSWDDNGLYLDLWGRDLNVILWKKWNDRYSDSRTQGFFGAVDPVKLMQFLLRCPISDEVGLNYNNQTDCEANNGVWNSTSGTCALKTQKIGYGLDTTDWILDATATADGYSVIYPKSRIMGFVWAKGQGVAFKNYFVDGFTNTINNWTNVGNGSLYDKDYATGIKGTVTNPFSGTDIHLTVNAQVGDTHITVNSASTLSAGNKIIICETVNHSLLLKPSNTTDVVTREEKIIDHISSNTIYLTTALTHTHIINEEFLLPSYSADPLPVHSKVYVTKCSDDTQSYYTFENVDMQNITLDAITLVLRGKWMIQNNDTCLGWLNNIDEFDGPDYPTAIVEVYLNVGSGWVDAGSISWDYTENFIINKSLDISSIVNTVAKLNACQMKLVSTLDFVEDCFICEAKIIINEAEFQKTDDEFIINLGSLKDRVCGIYIECRGINGNDKFARNYAIQTGVINTGFVGPIQDPNFPPCIWTTQTTQTNNKARDIIESWNPISCQFVKIRLTADYSAGWEISQIYVYQADDRKYCVWDDGSGSTLGPYLSGNLVAEDYIGTFGPIVPINFSFGRLIDSLNDIVTMCHDINYDTWDCWIDFNTMDFHFGSRKGTNKTSTIQFIKSDNIGKVNKEVNQRNATNRIKIVGKSESKGADEISSDWEENTDAESELGTFYESIVSSKKITNKESANLLANIQTRANGYAEIVHDIEITNDPYEPMAYDVGDVVTITDSLTNMSGGYWLKRIEKSIDGLGGEKIKFYVTIPSDSTIVGRASKYTDISDEWAKVRKQLREVGLGNTVIEDWFSDGAQQDKIDAQKISGSWSKDAKNEEQFAPTTNTDPAWYVIGAGENGNITGQDYLTYSNWFVVKGSKVNDNAYKTLKLYSKNIDSLLISDPSVPDIKFEYNPKFVTDVKIWKIGTNPSTDATTWRDGDSIFIGMSNQDMSAYFGFTIMVYQGEYLFYLTQKNSTMTTPTYLRIVKDINNNQLIIAENIKYHLSAEVDWDNMVINYSFNNYLVGILPIDTNYTDAIFPLFINLITSNANPITTWAQAYIYKFSSQWEWNPSG